VSSFAIAAPARSALARLQGKLTVIVKRRQRSRTQIETPESDSVDLRGRGVVEEREPWVDLRDVDVDLSGADPLESMANPAAGMSDVDWNDRFETFMDGDASVCKARRWFLNGSCR